MIQKDKAPKITLQLLLIRKWKTQVCFCDTILLPKPLKLSNEKVSANRKILHFRDMSEISRGIGEYFRRNRRFYRF